MTNIEKVQLITKIQKLLESELDPDVFEFNIDSKSDGTSGFNLNISVKDIKINEINKKYDFNKIGIKHNLIGMQFEREGVKYEIHDIKLSYRKYPIILKRLKGGTFIKAQKEFVIEGLGGENYINRIKNLEKLRNF